VRESHVKSNPHHYGAKIDKPTDFISLSYASVKAFWDALNVGARSFLTGLSTLIFEKDDHRKGVSHEE
jgi:hypothetical protein